MSAQGNFEYLQNRYLRESIDRNVTPAEILGEECRGLLGSIAYDGRTDRVEKILGGMVMFAKKYGIPFDPDMLVDLLKNFSERWHNWDASGPC